MSNHRKSSQRRGQSPRLAQDGTRVVRAGLPEPEQGEPFLPGPVFAAPFHFTGAPADSPNVYNRYGNPTWTRYEDAVGGLEDAEAVLFPSGMAAATALLLTRLGPGSVLAADAGSYHGVRRFAETHLEPRGVELRLAAPARLAEAAQGADLLWLETPSNPNLEVYDIAALTELGVPTVVDNTTAGPLLQRPLDLGAHFTLTSATKQMSGHADVMLGYVTTRDADAAQTLRNWRTYAGAIPGPFETWLAHRSLPTLALRLERGCDNALAIARLLAARDDVEAVRYPGLPRTPDTRWPSARCAAMEWSSPSTWARPSARRASSRAPSWSPTPPASAACTHARSGVPAGAAMPSRKGSSGCRRAARRRRICSRDIERALDRAGPESVSR